MAAEFIRSKDDPLQLKNFVNSWLGEPWESKSAVMDVDIVLQHKTECPMFIVPSWAQLLTGAVDVQKGHFYWEIHAWGPGVTSQVLGYGKVTTWEDINTVMSTLYPGEDGRSQYRVCIYGIDAGYRTETGGSAGTFGMPGAYRDSNNAFGIISENYPTFRWGKGSV